MGEVLMAFACTRVSRGSIGSVLGSIRKTRPEASRVPRGTVRDNRKDTVDTWRAKLSSGPKASVAAQDGAKPMAGGSS